MDSDLFERIVEDQIQILRETLLKKSIEYATCDRLHNFRTTAKLQQGNMKQALGGFMAKHTVSLYDMMYDGGDYSMDKWDEKIGDHIAYLFLLKAVCVEEDNTVRESHDRFDIEKRGRELTEMGKQGGRSYDASTKGSSYPR